jgi:hypothetical protein
LQPRWIGCEERPVTDLPSRMRLGRSVNVVPVVSDRHIWRFGAGAKLHIGVLVLPRDIVNAVVTHRQRKLMELSVSRSSTYQQGS